VKSGSIRVAVGRIRLDLPGASSLKEKRKVIKPLVQRLRDRFGVSAAEVGHQDVWHSAVVAVAAVGSDASELDSLMHDVMRFATRNADAVVVDFGVEVLGVGELHARPPAGREETVPDVGGIEEMWLGEEER
jgi:uncharacterized protein YlxP (DUF503 family)